MSVKAARESLSSLIGPFTRAVEALETAERAEANAAELGKRIAALETERLEKVAVLAQVGKDIEAAAAHRDKVNTEFDAAFKARRAKAEADLAAEGKAARERLNAEIEKLTRERDAIDNRAREASKGLAKLEAQHAELSKQVAQIRDAVGRVKL